jgi:uncharacterized protein
MDGHPSFGDETVDGGQSTAMDWRSHLLTSDDAITRALLATHRIAVIGIKTAESDQPAFGVPRLLQEWGFEIVPVPVYYPDVTVLLGEPVHRTLATIQPAVDLVQLFRRPVDIPRHLDELLAARPRTVWMQLGIRNDTVAETLARAGIDVVQDHCMKVEIMARRESGIMLPSERATTPDAHRHA